MPMTLWIGAHYEVRDIRYSQALAMARTRGPAEVPDPTARLRMIENMAWHWACHNALLAVERAKEYGDARAMLALMRRANSLCPGPIRRLMVGGVCID